LKSSHICMEDSTDPPLQLDHECSAGKESTSDNQDHDASSTSSEPQDPSTPTRKILLWSQSSRPILRALTKCTHIVRYDLKVTMEPSDKAVSSPTAALKSLIKKLKEADPTLLIAPYQERNQEERYLFGATGLPSTLTDIKKYFLGITPKSKGGACYARILLGHNRPVSEIMEDISWWLREQQAGLWKRPLQTEETVPKRWFLYSHQRIDLPVLQEHLEDTLQMQMGLRFRPIFYGIIEELSHLILQLKQCISKSLQPTPYMQTGSYL